MELIFVRHGETEFNRQDRFQGRIDTPLNKRGIKQAEALAKFCQEKQVQKIYISPLKRVKQTANIIAQQISIKPIIVEELKEICYGKWEGKRKEAIDEKILKKRERNLFNFIHPGHFSKTRGQSYKMLYEKVKPFFASLTRENKSLILIVAHAGIVRCAKKYFEKSDDSTVGSFRISNNSAYIVRLKESKRTTNILFY